MQALNNEDLTLFGDGLQTRSFQYYADLIDAIRLYMEKPKSVIDEFFNDHALGTPVLNVGNPGEYTIRQLAEEILFQIPESTSNMVYCPLPKDDPKRRKPDIALVTELLGWQPMTNLQYGLKQTIDYFKSLVKDSERMKIWLHRDILA